MTKVAVLDDYQNAALTLADWRSLGASVTVQAFRDTIADETALAARLRDFEIVVAMRERTPFPASLLQRLPKLKLLVTTGMRNASIDVTAAATHGITVCGTGMLGYPTAELTWGLILALLRHIVPEERAMREGRWQSTLGVGLRGKTLGVIGLGKLGAQVAAIGKAFQMAVIAWSQNLTAETAAANGVELVSKEQLFRRADIATVHLVLSPRSRGLVGATEFAQMRPTAYLINTSRGPIVDTAALMQSLQAKAIAGAAIDVYDQEPLPADHPLRKMDNLLLTPHLGYVTAENYREGYSQAVENIQAFLAGKPVRVLSS